MEFTSWDAGLHTKDPNSLQHYGILGMKWGERRYQNADGSLTPAGERHYKKTGERGYVYKSHATKKYDRKEVKSLAKMMKASAKGNKKRADKYAAKAEKFGNRKKRSQEIDRGEQEYAKGLSMGKAAAISLLGAGQVGKAYAQYRAMAGQKGKNMTGHKLTSAGLAYYMGTGGSRMRKAAYIRQDEGKKGLGQKVYKFNKKVQDVASNIIDTTAKANGGFPDRDKKRRR